MTATKIAFNQIEGNVISVKDKGATGNGVTDDRSAIFAADAAGSFVVPEGVYLVESDLTLTNSWESTGGILKPANGVTITLQGDYAARDELVFDLSLGGSIAIHATNSVREVRSAHFADVHEAALVAMEGNVDFTITEDIIDISETLYLGPADASAFLYTGTIKSNTTVNGLIGFTGDSLIVIRNNSGSHEGLLHGNAFAYADNAVYLYNVPRFSFDRLEGRRGAVWSVVVSSDEAASNSNSISGNQLRAELGGTTGVSTGTFGSNTGSATPAQRGTFNTSSVPLTAVVVKIRENYYFVTNNTGSQIEVYPSIATADQTATQLTWFSGGGIKFSGSDAGVGSYGSLVTQANNGLGMWCGSLYGQIFQKCVHEINTGPDILVGLTPTSASLKNSFSELYLERGDSNESIILLAPEPDLWVGNAFNVPANGVVSLYDNIIGASSRTQQVRMNRDLDGVAPRSPRYYFDMNATVLLELDQGKHMFVSSANAVATDFVIELNRTEDKDRDTDTIIDYKNFTARRLIVRDAEAGVGKVDDDLNGLILVNPGEGRIILHRDVYTNRVNWISIV